MTLTDALALKLHDTYGCRYTCRGGRLAEDRHPSHMEAYRKPALDILADPAFREALTSAVLDALDTVSLPVAEDWSNVPHPTSDWAAVIVAHMLPEAEK